MRGPVLCALLAASLLAAPAARADTFSKKYRFVLDKTLEADRHPYASIQRLGITTNVHSTYRMSSLLMLNWPCARLMTRSASLPRGES